MKDYLSFIFENLEKPLMIPTDIYIEQAFYQL